MSKRKTGEYTVNAVVYFLLILVLLITVIPIGWVLSTSVKPTTEVFANPPRWIPQAPTFEIYHQLYQDTFPSYGRAYPRCTA